MQSENVCDTVLVNQLRVDEWRGACKLSTTGLLNYEQLQSEVRGKRTTQLKRGKSQTVAMNAAKLKQAESSQLEKCDARIKSWKARVIQSGALGAKRECLSKLVARLKHDCTDDDAEDERNEEVLCDCFFPQYIVSPGTSPTMRRTKCKVRRDSCDIVSFKTVRRRVVQTSSQVMCDSCRRAVSAGQGCWLSDSDQSHFKQEQPLCTGLLDDGWYLLNVGILMNASRHCTRTPACARNALPGKETSPKGKRAETTAVVQGVMVETWKYEDEDYVFEFGHEVTADVQRRETHNGYRWCISISVSVWSRV